MSVEISATRLQNKSWVLISVKDFELVEVDQWLDQEVISPYSYFTAFIWGREGSSDDIASNPQCKPVCPGLSFRPCVWHSYTSVLLYFVRVYCLSLSLLFVFVPQGGRRTGKFLYIVVFLTPQKLSILKFSFIWEEWNTRATLYIECYNNNYCFFWLGHITKHACTWLNATSNTCREVLSWFDVHIGLSEPLLAWTVWHWVLRMGLN